ncbi:chromosome segregation protein SMC [Isachenkonia alkalipeptolytica]|uniref:chromosome segregation protein SMC n=1 Tax=Isachenkonia alkalipeptolytica TaxID=2565777 RepID=UPI001368D894|nr:chromosome segregation protein SMC [Isachenkonia alkalipeptolytica]
MHLKRVELKGFKSFASKITMDLETGVTGVVGPNGSGKSNISDGIKWVLGEQSAKTLRGAKMEDVIFSGTEKQKPLGMAEVSLVLDNEDGGIPIDFSEVKVTRRAYRSGENEYLINQSPCRLKDVRELFMDTGIGKDGYSIVGQGKIDEILSHKAEDRRKVIEEAVGIVKYKSRKEEAQRKLKGTEENLQRLSDILKELESRIDPLREQKEKAEKYLVLYETLKEGEVKQILRDIREIDEKTRGLEEEKQRRSEEIRKIKEEMEKGEEEILSLEEQILEYQQNHEEKEKEYYEKKDQIQETEGLRRMNEGEVQHLKDREEELQQRIRQGEERKEEIKTERSQGQREISELQSLLTTLDQDLKGEEDLYGKRQEKNLHRKEDVERIKGEIIGDMNQLSDWKVDLANLASLKKSIDQRKTQIENNLEKDETLREEKEERVKTLEKDFEDRENKEKIRKKEREALEASLNKKERETQKYLQSIQEKDRHLENKKSKIQMLKNLEASKEGFNRSVKEVLQKGKRDQSFARGLYGAVADLIKVPKGYELAIETALGYAMQNLVVKDEAKGKELIEHCKNNKLGRITVLPKTTVTGKNLQPREQKKVQDEPKASVALDIIQYPKELSSVFSSLLGKVVILPDLNLGVPMAKELNHRVKIVTLQGDVMNPGGSMTGGSRQQKSQGLLARKGELKTLQQETLAEEKSLENLRKEAGELQRETRSLEDQRREMDQKIQQIAIEKATLKEQLVQEKQRLEESRREIADRKKELGQLEETEGDYSKEHRILEEKINSLEARLEKNRSHIQVEEKDLLQQLDEIEGLKERIQEMQVRKASIEEQSKALGSKVQALDKEIHRQNRDIEENKEAIEKGHREKENIDQKIEAQTREIEQGKIALEALKKEAKVFKEKEEKALERKKEQEKRHKEQNGSLKGAEEDLYKLEMKATKLEVQRENLHQGLWEKYEMSDAQGREWIASKEGSLTLGQIQSLRKQIKDLGHVNLEAVEEYRETQERFDFLDQQQKDLLEAKKSLNRIIKEMESTMKTQFLQQLKVIKKEFNETFARLFGGGKADLVLEDEEDPLETGITILARPPGKKLQSLSLLSGGERALTAIALLFAILKIKPSPFCVLDEIEAALDESNVYRFAGFLKELAGDTQFIVVTHRKGTMEAADMLYGVTMETEGISKLVSVKMKDYVEDEKAM